MVQIKEKQISEKPNIRGVFWGDSPKKVQKTEKWIPKDKNAEGSVYYNSAESMLRFEGTLFDTSCILRYVFSPMQPDDEQDVLCRIEFNFPAMNETEAESLGTKLENALREKYGDPVQHAVNPLGSGSDGSRHFSRHVVHDNNQIVWGQTVIELYSKYDGGSGGFRIKIKMWHNEKGGADVRYQQRWIDEARKEERLLKQAVAGL